MTTTKTPYGHEIPTEIILDEIQTEYIMDNINSLAARAYLCTPENERKIRGLL